MFIKILASDILALVIYSFVFVFLDRILPHDRDEDEKHDPRNPL